MEKQLNVGDIVLIQKGMKIDVYIPEKFISVDFPFSSDECFTSITVGDVYQQRNFSKEELLEEFKSRTSDFFDLKDQQIERIIDTNPQLLIPKEYDTSYLVGRYIITGIGQDLIGELFVFAKHISLDNAVIRFYLESDCHPTIDEIEVL